MWRAFFALVALAALVAAIYPDVLLPMLIQRGIDLTALQARDNLQVARTVIGSIAVILLLLCLGRPLAADWRMCARTTWLPQSSARWWSALVQTPRGSMR